MKHRAQICLKSLLTLLLALTTRITLAVPSAVPTHYEYFEGFGFGLCIEKVTGDNYRDVIATSPLNEGTSLLFINNGLGEFPLPYSVFTICGNQGDASLG